MTPLALAGYGSPMSKKSSRRTWRLLRRFGAWVPAAYLLCTLFSPSCASRESAGFGAINVLSSGVINDPANKSLRFDLLKFGLEQFCAEMQRRGVALKLRDSDPNIGRFYATSCQSQVIDEEQRQSVVVRYAGRGFGWTNVTQRVGFQSQGLVEYAADFQMHGEAMYIYFRPRNVDSTSFQTTLVESQLANTGIAITGVRPDEVGQNIVQSQLRRGFTVIRYAESGETDFAIGVVALGRRPFHPFQVVSSERQTLDNDRTEVHSGQQDYIGGFTVPDDDQALYLTMTLDGAPEVDIMLLPKAMGDGLIATYTTAPGPAAPQSTAFGAVLRAGTQLRQYMPVPPGTYYLLVDHSAAVGQTAPPNVALDDRAARIDYLIQVGDRP